jgi:hypothetical protein
MLASFVPGIRAEWLKTRRSLASWLILSSAGFIPLLIFAIRLKRRAALPAIYRAGDFWVHFWTQAWESMTLMLIPIFIMLAASLIAQIEYRNNTWKQVHTSPQPSLTTFLSKLVMIVVIVIAFFAAFNAALYLSAIGPAVLLGNVPFPTAAFPWDLFLERNLRYFIDCLPVIAIQYMLALHFRNFMVPLGVGMALWILALGSFSWEYNYLIPFSYCGIDYLVESGNKVSRHFPVSLQAMALTYFVVFTIAGYIVYATKKERG